MGSAVEATCKCGYHVSIMIGGVMANFLTTCYFPCLCEQCREVVEVNLIAKRLRCPQCRKTEVIPYDDPRLQAVAGRELVTEWHVEEEHGRPLKLMNGAYLCPQCNQGTLRFADAGLCWD